MTNDLEYINTGLFTRFIPNTKAEQAAHEDRTYGGNPQRNPIGKESK